MKHAVIPRAAVSVAARFYCPSQQVPLYVLVQLFMLTNKIQVVVLAKRGKEPNKGMWSLPGGKIELGESTIQAAQRELWEETKLVTATSVLVSGGVKWHPVPFTSTDSIHFDSEYFETGLEQRAVLFHYVISQCFAEVVADSARLSANPPKLRPCDDAMDAKWWTMMDVEKGVKEGIVSKGCDFVLEKAEELYSSGFLPCF